MCSYFYLMIGSGPPADCVGICCNKDMVQRQYFIQNPIIITNIILSIFELFIGF